MLFLFYKSARLNDEESFGDFCYRAGKESLSSFVGKMLSEDISKDKDTKSIIEHVKNSVERPDDKYTSDFIGGKADKVGFTLV